MNFDPPNAVAIINAAVADASGDGDAWEVIGEPLNTPVDEILPKYNDKLDLKLSEEKMRVQEATSSVGPCSTQRTKM